MPSVASEVNASLSLPPSQRPRPQSAAADSAPQPFSSLLDATAPAPEAPPEPDVQGPPQRAEPPAASSSHRADNDPGRPAKSTSGATDRPKPAASKDDARVANKKDGKAAKETAKSDAEAAKSDTKAQDVPTTPDADDGKDKATDDAVGKDAATPVTTQAQAPVTPQPVAAAVAVTGLITAASDPAPDADKTGSIDADKNAKPTVLDANAAATGDAKDAAVGDIGKGAAAAAIAAPGSRPATDAKARPAEDPGKPANAEGAVDKAAKAAHAETAKAIEPADAGHAELRHEATPDLDGQTGAAGSAGDQPQAAAVKQNADALPNFGFSTSNATSAAASPTTSAASATTAAVPIAGLAVEIAARAQSGSNRFDIRLDPPELGRIDVRLDVNRDGQVTSHVTVDRPETLTLLQHEQPNLERALEQAGLKTTDNGLQFTLRDQSFTGQDNGGRSGQNTARLVIPDADLGTVETITSRYRSLGVGGGVDISV